MKKDVAWLNTQWWYRLIKVVYIVSSVVFVVLSVAVSFAMHYPATKYINVLESRMYCTEGNMKDFSFVYLDVNRTDAFLAQFNEKIVDIKTAADFCELTPLPSRIDTSMFVGGSEPATDLEFEEAVERIHDSYYTEVVYDTEGGMPYAIGFGVLASVLIVLGYEFLRRMFYYVVLGSLRPE